MESVSTHLGMAILEQRQDDAKPKSKAALEKLDHRPRKYLGYRTPHEIYYKLATLPPDLSYVALRV